MIGGAHNVNQVARVVTGDDGTPGAANTFRKAER